MTTVTRSVDFAIKRKVRKKQPVADTGRVPRISKLMALAIRYDQLLNEGVVKSQTELAELLHVSQPRMTQIMNLLHLSPEIQEDLLHQYESRTFLEHAINERAMRELTGIRDWVAQKEAWEKLILLFPNVFHDRADAM